MGQSLGLRRPSLQFPQCAIRLWSQPLIPRFRQLPVPKRRLARRLSQSPPLIVDPPCQLHQPPLSYHSQHGHPVQVLLRSRHALLLQPHHPFRCQVRAPLRHEHILLHQRLRLSRRKLRRHRLPRPRSPCQRQFPLRLPLQLRRLSQPRHLLSLRRQRPPQLRYLRRLPSPLRHRHQRLQRLLHRRRTN